ncbi:MAG: hypothetical protein RLY93_15530 [Sumerlaeia bacterium]
MRSLCVWPVALVVTFWLCPLASAQDTGFLLPVPLGLEADEELADFSIDEATNQVYVLTSDADVSRFSISSPSTVEPLAEAVTSAGHFSSFISFLGQQRGIALTLLGTGENYDFQIRVSDNRVRDLYGPPLEWAGSDSFFALGIPGAWFAKGTPAGTAGEQFAFWPVDFDAAPVLLRDTSGTPITLPTMPFGSPNLLLDLGSNVLPDGTATVAPLPGLDETSVLAIISLQTGLPLAEIGTANSYGDIDVLDDGRLLVQARQDDGTHLLLYSAGPTPTAQTLAVEDTFLSEGTAGSGRYEAYTIFDDPGSVRSTAILDLTAATFRKGEYLGDAVSSGDLTRDNPHFFFVQPQPAKGLESRAVLLRFDPAFQNAPVALTGSLFDIDDAELFPNGQLVFTSSGPDGETQGVYSVASDGSSGLALLTAGLPLDSRPQVQYLPTLDRVLFLSSATGGSFGLYSAATVPGGPAPVRLFEVADDNPRFALDALVSREETLIAISGDWLADSQQPLRIQSTLAPGQFTQVTSAPDLSSVRRAEWGSQGALLVLGRDEDGDDGLWVLASLPGLLNGGLMEGQLDTVDGNDDGVFDVADIVRQRLP